MTTELDPFETAVLAELRSVVTNRRPARRRKRVLTLGGVAASTAAAVGIGLAIGGSSPAFAVHQQADGDIVVTIHRMDDAKGLEQALADQGVSADVDYTHPVTMKTTDGLSLDTIPLPARDTSSHRVVIQRGTTEEGFDCSFGKGGFVTLDATDDGFVLTIPRESVLAETPVEITTATASDHHPVLAVSYYDRQCIQIASPSK